MDLKRKEILKLYEGLRVTDVNDGMDAVGLQNVGIMSRDIRPLWRDIDNFKHRIYGFAYTIRYLPANMAIHAQSAEEYNKIKVDWYGNLASSKSWVSSLQKGDVLVMDGATATDVGFIGSENCFNWINRGVAGVVTNGGCRDTDELIKQQLPVYSNYIGRGIKPGRITFESSNIPINVGNVLVRPGDFVVADGDGVVVVPIEKVYDVAKIARDIQDGDKASRRKHYETAGLELDFTVK